MKKISILRQISSIVLCMAFTFSLCGCAKSIRMHITTEEQVTDVQEVLREKIPPVLKANKEKFKKLDNTITVMKWVLGGAVAIPVLCYGWWYAYHFIEPGSQYASLQETGNLSQTVNNMSRQFVDLNGTLVDLRNDQYKQNNLITYRLDKIEADMKNMRALCVSAPLPIVTEPSLMPYLVGGVVIVGIVGGLYGLYHLWKNPAMQDDSNVAQRSDDSFGSNEESDNGFQPIHANPLFARPRSNTIDIASFDAPSPTSQSIAASHSSASIPEDPWPNSQADVLLNRSSSKTQQEVSVLYKSFEEQNSDGALKYTEESKIGIYRCRPIPNYQK